MIHTLRHRTLRTAVHFLAVLFSLAVSATTNAIGQVVTPTPVAWPTTWTPYSVKNTPITDAKSADPSNGGTSPQGSVNITSGAIEFTAPSAYYASNGTHLFVRFRLESSPSSYAAGAKYGNTDPWSSAQWTFLLDIEGDGWRDFAILLNGASGSPSTPIDRIQIIYSRLTTTQSIDPALTGVYLLAEVPAADVTGNELQEYNGSGQPVANNWATTTTVLDFGRTRVIDETATGGDYLLDFQVPISLLDASAYNGPALANNTIMSAAFTTSNSLSDPFQKDFAYIEAVCADPSNPMPGGDPFTIEPTPDLPEIIVTEVTAEFCPTVQLTTRILTAQQMLDCYTVVSSAVDVRFYYYYDQNANGSTDDFNESWTLVGYGTPTSLGVWSATWNSGSLPTGQYLIKVVASDTAGYAVDSDLQTLSQFYRPIAIINNSCGVNPGIVTKTVSPSVVLKNDPSTQRTVTYTITLQNTQATTVAIDTLYDILPQGFTFVAGSEGGTLASSIASSPIASTDSIAWTFSGASVAPGASRTLTFQAVAPAVTGTYRNSAAALGSTYFLPAVNTAPVIVSDARASLSKSTSVATGVNPGQTLAYTLTVQNTGEAGLTDITVTDSLVQGIQYLFATITPTTVSGQKIIWTLNSGTDTLFAGATRTIQVTVQVLNPYSGTNPLINAARLTAPQLLSPVVSNTVQNTVLGAVLSLQKSASPQYVTPGNTVGFTLVYNNVGTATAEGVVVRDTLPGNLRYVPGSALPAATSIDSITLAPRTVLTWTVGQIPAGNSNLNSTITFQAFVADPYPSRGVDQVERNVATISRTHATPPPSSVSYTVGTDVYVTAVPAVSLTKTSNLAVYAAGDSGTFTLTLTNTGTFAASLDSLADVLPSLFTYGWTSGGTLLPTVSPTPGATGRVTWKFSPAETIAPGQTKTLQFRGRVSIVGVYYTNTAHAYGILTGAAAGSVSASLPLTVAEGIEAINKSVDKSLVFSGDTLTYTIYYLNASGSKKARTITDTLAPSLTFLSETHSFGSFDGATGQALSWSFNNLSNGGSVTITIKALVDSGGVTIPNRATFSSSPVTYSNQVTTISQNAPNLSFTKSADQVTAPIGTEILYTIAYSNAPGSSSSTSTIVTDTIPSFMTYVAGSVTGGGLWQATPSPKGRIVWSLGTVAANTAGTLTYRTRIDSSTIGGQQIVNTARLSNAQGQALFSRDTVTVTQQANIILLKNVDAFYAGPGDTLVYTISYTNTGNAPQTGIVITDSIPSSTSLVSIAGGGTSAGGVVTWSFPAQTINVGDTNSVQMTVALPMPMTSGSVDRIYNTARALPTGLSQRVSNTVQTNVIYPQVYPTKSVDVAVADIGQVLTYTIEVTNATIIAATQTIVTDTIPANTVYVPNSTTLDGIPQSDPGPGVSPLEGGMTIGTVLFSAPRTITFQVQIAGSATRGSTIANHSVLTTAKLTGSVTGNTVSTTVSTLSFSTSTKSATDLNADILLAGDTLQYTIHVANTGIAAASPLTVKDPVPTGLSLVPGSYGIAILSGDTLLWTIASLGVGASTDLTFLAVVDTAIADNTPIPNAATINSAGLTYVVSTTVTAYNRGRMTLSLAVNTPTSAPGDTLTYTATYANVGTSTATTVILTVSAAPINTAYVPGTILLNGAPKTDAADADEITLTGTTIQVTLGNVTAGTIGTVVFKARVE